MRLIDEIASRVPIARALPEAFGGAKIYMPALSLFDEGSGRLEAMHKDLLSSAMLVAAGQVVWDIGAGIGVFTAAAAMRSGRQGRVIACEDVPSNLRLLRKTVSRLPGDSARLTLASLVVSQEFGLKSAIDTLSETSLGSSNRAYETCSPQFSLDWLLDRWPSPNILRLDARHAHALEQQDRMLTAIRPAIICALTPEHNSTLLRVLRSAKYVLYDASQTSTGAFPTDRGAPLTIALPGERQSAMLVCSFSQNARE